MPSYDFLMLAVLIGCMVLGAWKGMAWQLASLASIGASYFAAVNFSGVVAPMISAEAPWNKAAAMLILYIVTSIAVWMVFRVLAGVIDSVRLRDFDRQLGALFGGAKGVLLCMVITFFAVSLNETTRIMVRESKAGYYMTLLIDEAHPFVPQRVHEVLHPYAEQFKQQLRRDQGWPNTPSSPTTPAPGTAPRSFPNILGDSTTAPASNGPALPSDTPGSWQPNTGQGSPTDSTAGASRPRETSSGGLWDLGSRILRGAMDEPRASAPS